MLSVDQIYQPGFSADPTFLVPGHKAGCDAYWIVRILDGGLGFISDWIICV